MSETVDMKAFDKTSVKNALCVKILNESYHDIINKSGDYIYTKEYKIILNYLEKYKNRSINECEYTVGYELLQELSSLSGIFCTNEEYIIRVISEYKNYTTHTLEDILDNYKYFLMCRKKGISAYYALNMLNGELNKDEKDKC